MFYCRMFDFWHKWEQAEVLSWTERCSRDPLPSHERTYDFQCSCWFAFTWLLCRQLKCRLKPWIHEAIVAAIAAVAAIACTEYTRRRSPLGRHFDRQYDRRDDRLVYSLHYDADKFFRAGTLNSRKWDCQRSTFERLQSHRLRRAEIPRRTLSNFNSTL